MVRHTKAIFTSFSRFDFVQIMVKGLFSCFLNIQIEKRICDALRDLLPFVQFKNVKNTHGGGLILVKLQA